MKIEDVVSTLMKFKLVHSIILYGSRAIGTQREESDFDLCIMPNPGMSIGLKERIALENSIPENIDLSLMDELPVNIRKRVFLEGKVLYTKDLYYILTLAKETEMEYIRYRNLKKDYHKAVMNRVKARIR
ncbi:MAG: nucleotidyltransferase domain-containing protein [Methanosarcinales archaeon]|jgi:predicted nucleotidyltransferase|nr:nucleotidyltransferase domain-containing protein [Methanosarcinales archaeon]